MALHWLQDWLWRIKEVVPPFCVELVLRDHTRYWLHSTRPGDDGDRRTAQQPDGIMVWGAGATSCGEFLKAMHENPRSEVAFGQWLHGYITARNCLDLKAVD